MSEATSEEAILEQEALAHQHQQDAGNDGFEANEGAEQQEAGAEAQRARRPGKLERRLAAAERAADEARAAAEHARQQASYYARQLAEASEAGNRFAQDGIKSRLDRAEDSLRNAIHAGDADAVVKANRQIAELSALSAQMQNAPRQQQQEAPQQPAAPSYTPTTRAWLDANPWYGRDPELTTIAKAAHAAAKRQGIETDTPEYWRFVEKGVESMAPGTVRTTTHGDDDGEDDPPPRRATPPVRTSAPPTRTNATTRPNATREINLTAEELDAAKVSGMTPQEYKSWQAKLRAAGRFTAGAR